MTASEYEENTHHEDAVRPTRWVYQAIAWVMIGYNEGRVIFDRYQDQSPKRTRRDIRGQWRPQNLQSIHKWDPLCLSRNWPALFSLIVCWTTSPIVHSNWSLHVYDAKVKGNTNSQIHYFPIKFCASEVIVLDWTYHPTLTFSCFSSIWYLDHIGAQNGLKFLTGKGTNYREIDMVEWMLVIGRHKFQGLVGPTISLELTWVVNVWESPRRHGLLPT
jgi:hypothetical protein